MRYPRQSENNSTGNPQFMRKQEKKAKRVKLHKLNIIFLPPLEFLLHKPTQ
jgi:hypothetical protein